MLLRPKTCRRTGGVYIAVLGSSMIIALLGMCALFGQRIQNRLVVASSNIRQAQLNANAAVEIALLTMKQDASWRTTYSNGNWFTNRSTGIGSCTANVIDPVDDTLAGGPDDPVVVTGIGYSGGAEQRVQVTVDPKKTPLTCLRSAVAAGNNITLSSDVLRTNGLTTANQISASSSTVHGKVEAASVSGATYTGTTTTVSSENRPTMPDWTAVFNYYRNNGTQIDINLLPTSTPNLGLNVGIENGTTSWTGTATGAGEADISATNNFNRTSGGNYSMRVRNRDNWYAGASQSMDSYVKQGQQYTVEGYVYLPLSLGITRNFRFSIYTKGTNSAANQAVGADNLIFAAIGWQKVSGTITAPLWSGNLEYAFVKIAGDSNNSSDFYFDDFTIRETTTGRFIYRKVLGPGVNPFGGGTNSEGIYWINCNNNRLIIERSRIVGTLLVINPGANSCIKDGPISWTPAVPGYPALLVDADTGTADFSILATNRALSEKENTTNFNPSGAASDEFGVDSDTNDIYRSQIRGLVAVRRDLVYGNRSITKGQIIVGNNIANSSGELEVDYQPDSLLNPPPGFWSYTYSRRAASTRKAVLP